MQDIAVPLLSPVKEVPEFGAKDTATQVCSCGPTCGLPYFTSSANCELCVALCVCLCGHAVQGLPSAMVHFAADVTGVCSTIVHLGASFIVVYVLLPVRVQPPPPFTSLR